MYIHALFFFQFISCLKIGHGHRKSKEQITIAIDVSGETFFTTLFAEIFTIGKEIAEGFQVVKSEELAVVIILAKFITFLCTLCCTIAHI